MGLLSARGSKAGEHFIYASHVAERVTSEHEKRAAGERKRPAVTRPLRGPDMAVTWPLPFPLSSQVSARTCCRRRSSSSGSASRSARRAFTTTMTRSRRAVHGRYRRHTGPVPSPLPLPSPQESDEEEVMDDSPEVMAAVESEMMQVLNRSTVTWPSHGRYIPLQVLGRSTGAVTYRYIPLHTVAYRYLPLPTVTGPRSLDGRGQQRGLGGGGGLGDHDGVTDALVPQQGEGDGGGAARAALGHQDGRRRRGPRSGRTRRVDDARVVCPGAPHLPLHTVTYRYIPLHTVTYRYIPCS